MLSMMIYPWDAKLAILFCICQKLVEPFMSDGKPRRPLITPSFPLILNKLNTNPLTFLHTFLLKLLKVSTVFFNNSCIFMSLNPPLYMFMFDIFIFHFSFMVIIRDLDDNDILIEPLNCDEFITLWNHYYRNARLPPRQLTVN